jgi:integrase
VVRDSEYENLLLLAMHTGMRTGELRGLTWDCVEFERRLLRVSKAFRQMALWARSRLPRVGGCWR